MFAFLYVSKTHQKRIQTKSLACQKRTKTCLKTKVCAANPRAKIISFTYQMATRLSLTLSRHRGGGGGGGVAGGGGGGGGGSVVAQWCWR